MEITASTLARFRSWMVGRGRTDGTADLYVKNLRACAGTGELVDRLVKRGLAPLSKRTNKAALSAWARYSKDDALAESLGEIKLPPARRVGVKLPLSVADWRRVAGHLETCRMADESLRSVCLIITRRGLRVGDVLRIQRTEVMASLASGILSFVGKGEKRHEFAAAPIRRPLEQLGRVTGWKHATDLISDGKHAMAASNRIRRVFARAAAELAIEGVYPHRFRRTYATQFLEALAGDPRALIKLQNHMGWASLQTAAGYADAVDRSELSTIGEKMIVDVLG